MNRESYISRPTAKSNIDSGADISVIESTRARKQNYLVFMRNVKKPIKLYVK